MISRLAARSVGRSVGSTRAAFTVPGLFREVDIVNNLTPYNLSHDPLDAVKPIPVFQQLNEESKLDPSAEFFPELTKEEVVNLFDQMVKVNVMDNIFQDIQRQGRISFYITNFGEEGAQLGSISALKREDEVWTQYRELGCFLFRGLTSQMATDQLFSTKFEQGKGRQMPIHYVCQFRPLNRHPSYRP